jgi:CheY-like chemotaxis protein
MVQGALNEARMEEKQILIVDDEPKVAFFLAKALMRVNPGYGVGIAHSGEEALNELRRTAVDLLITDLRMPGINGLELMKRVRTDHPDSRLVLMTAYGNAEIEAMAYQLGACRYITKPFSLNDLIETVQSALEEPEAPGKDILMLSDERFEAIAQHLASLRFEVGAQCIILADVSGPIVAHVGETQGLNIPTLVSLAGGSFATSSEMSRCLGETKALTLNYHEGEKYDVYSSSVTPELFLMLVFYKQAKRSRIGMVWLYIQRSLQKLRTLVEDAERVGADEVLDAEFGSMLSDSLDELFTADAETEKLDASTRAEESETIEAVEEATPPSPASEDELQQVRETFNLEQALEMGLVDSNLLGNDE